MKKFLLISFVILFSHVIGQNKSIIVEYNYLPGKYEQDASNNYLYLNENHNVFFLYGTAGTELKFENIEKDFKKGRIGSIVDHISDNKFLFTGYMTGSKRYLTEDNSPKITWNLKNESKEILGYKCYKAEGAFRGRNWIAWYTPQIASQLGPWKIGGLPGLVLEAYTDKDEYKYTARRILTNSSLPIPQGITEYIKEKKENIIPFKEYIEKENEFIMSLSSEQLSSMPTGTTLVKEPVRHAQIESIFEWEDPKKP